MSYYVYFSLTNSENSAHSCLSVNISSSILITLAFPTWNVADFIRSKERVCWFHPHVAIPNGGQLYVFTSAQWSNSLGKHAAIVSPTATQARLQITEYSSIDYKSHAVVKCNGVAVVSEKQLGIYKVSTILLRD